MGGMLGGGGKKAPVPKVPPPPPTPEVGPEVDDYAAKVARRRKGFKESILTGALSPGTGGKKSLLG